MFNIEKKHCHICLKSTTEIKTQERPIYVVLLLVLLTLKISHIALAFPLLPTAWLGLTYFNKIYNTVVSILFSTNIYLFKVNNRNTRKRCEIRSKLRTRITERRH